MYIIDTIIQFFSLYHFYHFLGGYMPVLFILWISENQINSLFFFFFFFQKIFIIILLFS